MLNTTGSPPGGRGVATWVPPGTTTVVGCGADSQNVCGTRAAVAGKVVTPSRSRKVVCRRSGTRLSR